MRIIDLIGVLACLVALSACGKSGGSGQATARAVAPDRASVSTQSAPPPQTSAAPAATSAKPDAAAPTGPLLSDAQLAIIYKALNLKSAPNGQVMNDCGEAVTPAVFAANVGGAVGRAYLIVVAGGPNTLTCYGMTGMLINLMKTEGGGYRSVLTDYGSLAVMPTEHKGVKDVAVGGPGFEFPVYEWDGMRYVPSRKIKDTQLPPALN